MIVYAPQTSGAMDVRTRDVTRSTLGNPIRTRLDLGGVGVLENHRARITRVNEIRRTHFIYSGSSYVRLAMKTLNRVGTWILTHPRLVAAIAVTAFAVAMLAMPAVGIAGRRPGK